MAKAFGGLGVTSGLAADRSSLSGMVAGQQFFETDTRKLFVYNGSSWVQDNDYTLSAVTVDSSGRVKFPFQPRFWARRNGASVSATSVIVFDSVGANVGNHYNNSNGRFTAPIAGDYFFSLTTIGWNTGTTRIAPRINGVNQSATFHLRAINTGNYGDASMSWIYSLNANDWVDCLIFEQWAYGSADWYTHWMGYLMG